MSLNLELRAQNLLKKIQELKRKRCLALEELGLAEFDREADEAALAALKWKLAKSEDSIAAIKSVTKSLDFAIESSEAVAKILAEKAKKALSDTDYAIYTFDKVILGLTPAGASTQTVLRYLQDDKSAKFRQDDEGTEAGNMRKYGTPEPPEYDLSQLQVPVSMHYSLNDDPSFPEDVAQKITDTAAQAPKALSPGEDKKKESDH